MTIETTPLKDCLLIRPTVFKDQRGSFIETYNHQRFVEKTGIDRDFVQDNQSVSVYGSIRGLHLQMGEFAQAKLVRVVQGEVLDVVVDVRKESPTYGKSHQVKLSSDNNHQLYVPRGFAHGFATLSEQAVFAYKCDNYYCKEAESGILYNDPQLDIGWQLPEKDIILSEKDQQLLSLRDFTKKHA